jgi:hypothetical protein
MKKLLLAAGLVIVVAISTFGQPFAKGEHAINLGLGFGNTYPNQSYYGFRPSISGSYEYGIVEVPMGSDLTGVVSVGGYLGWAGGSHKYDNDATYHVTHFYMAARGNYHFIFHDKLDTYAGIWMGGRISGDSWSGDGQYYDDIDAVTSGFAGGFYVGGRWYFTDNFAIYSEIGYLISIFNFGVTWKIE